MPDEKLRDPNFEEEIIRILSKDLGKEENDELTSIIKEAKITNNQEQIEEK